MARVYVSVGSNCDREQAIRSAVAAFQETFGRLDISTIYQSRPVGFTGDDFYNLVIGFDTVIPVSPLAGRLRALEYALGRRRNAAKLVSRRLDLDLLLYGDLVMREGKVRLPREDITRYAFVLRPLAELAGGRRHPELGVTYAELWADFDKNLERLFPVAFDFAPQPPVRY